MVSHLPAKLGHRQARFCLLIVDGKSAIDAYAEAYGSKRVSAEANAYRLMANDGVKREIVRLQAARAAAALVTAASLTADLRRVGLAAETAGNHSAAVAAHMGIAKLHGFLIDRVQADMLIRKPISNPDAPDEMSEDLWLAAHGIGQVIDSIAREPASESIDRGAPSIDGGAPSIAQATEEQPKE